MPTYKDVTLTIPTNTPSIYTIDTANRDVIEISSNRERLTINCDDIVLMQSSLGIEVPAIQSTIKRLDSIMINGILFKKVD